VKGESQADKIITLTSVGLSASEVAQLLGTKPNTVAVAVYQHNKKKSKRGSRTRPD
jgi:DNA-binding CsgD family transcriptional regulator